MNISPIGINPLKDLKTVKHYKNLELKDIPLCKYLVDKKNNIVEQKISLPNGIILRTGEINGQKYNSLLTKEKKSTKFSLNDAFVEKLFPSPDKGTVRNFHLEGEKKNGKISKLTKCEVNITDGFSTFGDSTELKSRNLESLLKKAEKSGVKMHNLTKNYINTAIEFLKSMNS